MSVAGYTVGFTVLGGLWVLPLTILWFISFCLARRKNDPARVGISWMKVVFPFWILGSIFHVVQGGLNLWLYYGVDWYYSSSSEIAIYQAVNHVFTMAEFFKNLADIFLFVTFVELANGFLLCLKGPGEPSRSRKISRIAIAAWGVVLFALIISLFGLGHAYAVRYYSEDVYDTDSSDYESNFESSLQMAVSMNRLRGAIKVLMWLTSIPMLALAAAVVHKTKAHAFLRNVAVLFLVATIFDFIRLLVVMAIYAQAYLSSVYLATAGRLDLDPAVLTIVDPFFDYVFMFVALVLLFSLAVKKRMGLWSQPPPEWNYPTVVFLPPGQAVMQQQQQQQQMPMAMPMQNAGVVPGQQVPGQQQQQPQMQVPQQGLPAYLQYAQQQQIMQQQQAPQQQQGQPMVAPQGYYYYPQQQQQPPAPTYQPQDQQQQHQQVVEPKAAGA